LARVLARYWPTMKYACHAQTLNVPESSQGSRGVLLPTPNCAAIHSGALLEQQQHGDDDQQNPHRHLDEGPEAISSRLQPNLALGNTQPIAKFLAQARLDFVPTHVGKLSPKLAYGERHLQIFLNFPVYSNRAQWKTVERENFGNLQGNFKAGILKFCHHYVAGSNRQYIEEVIPHIGSLLSANL
jgi:hypothetical protein